MHGAHWNGSRWVYRRNAGVTQRGIYRRLPPLPQWNRVRARHNWKVAIGVARGQAKRKIALRNYVKRNFVGMFAKKRNYFKDFYRRGRGYRRR